MNSINFYWKTSFQRKTIKDVVLFLILNLFYTLAAYNFDQV